MKSLKNFIGSFRRKLEDVENATDEGLSVEETMIEILPLLRSDKEILAVLEKMDYNYKICCKALPFLKMTTKSESEIMKIISATGYKKSALCAFFRFLNVEEKTEEQRYALLEESQFNVEFCRWMLPFLFSKKIMHILSACKYDIRLSVLAVKLLPKKEDVLKVMEETKYHQAVCLAVLKNFK